MKNFVQPGHVIDVIAPTGGVVSGVPFLLGVILCVPQMTAAQTELVACAVNGVFDLPKATGVTPAAGGLAYWDDTAKKVTTASASNTLVGWFVNAGLTGDTTIWVKLDR